MTPNQIGLSILVLAIALLIAKIIRINFKIFSKFFLPSSVIAGFLLLMIGPEVLGKFLDKSPYGLLTVEMLTVFKSLPGLLITIIFASLFIGKKLPKVKDIWKTAGPQVAFGQTLAWGQYVVGTLVTLLILVPFFNASPMAGALIEIAFEGGHGTAAGLKDTFIELGYPDGAELAMGLATVGIVFGVLIGVFMINWAVRKEKTAFLKEKKDMDVTEVTGIIPKEERVPTSFMTVSPESIEPLALHLGVIAMAVVFGVLMQKGLIWIEDITWGKTGFYMFKYIPLFPLAMLGGVIVQFFINKFDKPEIINRQMIVRLQGLALDFLLVAAIAALSLTVIGSNIEVFLILSITGILWNTLVFMFLAKRMLPEYWFERGIGDYGQSMGMTAIGLMLIRIVDTKNKSKALEAFGYKQLLFEPFVGGGIMTAISVPLIYQFGLIPVFIITLLITLFFLLLGLFHFGKKKQTTK
ncbi:Sodium/glutamate symporter [Paracholeplasma brassicae]|uniref:Sodium/glutamate symporter n=1 Tax=Acholeplasma brassicae TaxID=61635 RepID=U4KPT6_9MOLU|nr:sodium/glutamate symporter [Paracholeplasma brassicae]CCV66487.1 Sodium/glutamate symporter [Paracholeplasma brassicae]